MRLFLAILYVLMYLLVFPFLWCIPNFRKARRAHRKHKKEARARKKK